MIFKPKSVTVNITGDVTKNLYVGEFLFKTMLSHSDQFAIARKRKQLVGDNKDGDLPVVLVEKAIILSQLSARIVQAPDWWGDGSDLMDTNVILELFEKAVECENEELRKLQGDATKAKAELEKIVDNANKTEVTGK